jgi:hypothetical protein
MPTQFADLTDTQKAQFAADLAAVGLSHDTVPTTVTADGTSEPSFTSHTVTINDLPHLKALAGVADEHFASGGSDSHVQYPAPLPADRARVLVAASPEAASTSLTPEEAQSVQASKLAFVTGNSTKVAPELVTLANQDFPITAAVSAAQDLVISGPTELSGLIVCGTITIKPGGVIKITKETSIKTQVITKL